MKLLNGIAIVVMLMAGIVSAGETVFKLADTPEAIKKQWTGKFKVEKLDAAPPDGDCLVASGVQCLVSTEFKAIDPDKTYELSGKMKSGGKDLSRVYFGFVCFDKNKRQINPLNANPYPGAVLTELAASARKGDKSILIKDAGGWTVNKGFGVAAAFNAKDDFSDLPNFDVGADIAKITRKGDNFELELAKPLAKDYPAGTKVREHYRGFGYYLYSAAANSEVPADWKNYSAKVKMASNGKAANNLFRPGTAFVKIIFLANYAQKDKETELDITGVELKESD